MLQYRTPNYYSLPLSSLSPGGWMRRQLEIQSEGLPGRLDQIKELPFVSDSRWLGGKSEMCADTEDAFPYWLGGYLPMARLLGEEKHLRHATQLVEQILNLQTEDGWVGPTPTESQNDDERARFEYFSFFGVANALIAWADDASAHGIETFLYRAYQKLYDWTDKHMPRRWTAMTGSRGLVPLYWLYERRPEAWMLALAHRFRCQFFDYLSFYRDWPCSAPTVWADWNILSHVVNNNIALASGPLNYQISGREEDLHLADRMYDALTEAHGTVIGHFNGDECLSGHSPLQGAELCSIVELLTSCYLNFSITGNPEWMDRAEALAFNSFPATVSADMETHQYDQQVNQVNLQLYTGPHREKIQHPVFSANDGSAALFGWAPHYPCCACNMGQGFPGFAAHEIMLGEHAPAVLSYVPMKAVFPVQGVDVTLEITGDYPFREQVTIRVSAKQPVAFPLDLRIPSWAKGASVNGKPAEAGTMHRLEQTWKEETVSVCLPMEAEWVSRPNDLYTLKRGPLFYALRIDAAWKKVQSPVEGAPYALFDYELSPKSKWNYGVWNQKAEFREREIHTQPFSPQHPPVEAKVLCREIDWPLVDGMAALQPASRKGVGEPVWLTFIPYGCTDLRLTELPMLQKG